MGLIDKLREIAGSFSSYKSRCEVMSAEIANLSNEMGCLKISVKTLEKERLALRTEIENAEGLADEIIDIIKQA